MNTSSNPTPPFSPLSQPGNGKPRFRIAVIMIVALHAVFFGGLLLQGCKPRTGEQAGTTPTTPGYDSAATNFTPLTTPAYPELTNLPPATNLWGAVTDTTPGGLTTPSGTVDPLAAFVTPGQEPLAPATPQTKEYVIKKGDYPAKIAKNHGISVEALMAANPGLDPRKLVVDAKLNVPAAPPATPPAPDAAGAAPAGKIHVVKKGENLTRIARQHGVTVKQIRSANNLRSDRIVEKQKLTIPAPAPATGGSAPLTPATVSSNLPAFR